MINVLICEDDPLLAYDLKQAVEAAGGHVVAVASCGQRAISIASTLELDLAIIDLTLADGRTGADVAKFLSERGCRIAVLSGDTSVVTELSSISHTFIPKPLPIELIARVLSSTFQPREIA